MRTKELKRLIPAALTFSMLAGCMSEPSNLATPLSQQNERRNVKREAACPCVYVANEGGYDGDSIAVYPVGSTGNVEPIQFISGSSAQLGGVIGVAVDSSGNIYAANEIANSITVYAPGATGDVAPTAVISGSNTGLNGPLGVAIDPVNGDIYAENLGGGPSGNGSITFYAAGSNGNVAPLGTIAGSNTQLDASGRLTLDPSGDIYAASEYAILVYAAGSSGNVAPMQIISGSRTKVNPTQLAIDSNLDVYACSTLGKYASSVTAYPPGSTGNVRPSKAYIHGSNTKLRNSWGIALDANNNIYVASFNTNAITVYPAGSTGDVAPSATIKGKKTLLHQPYGIAIH